MAELPLHRFLCHNKTMKRQNTVLTPPPRRFCEVISFCSFLALAASAWPSSTHTPICPPGQVLNTADCTCKAATPTPPTPPPAPTPSTCSNTCNPGYTQGAYPGCACTCNKTDSQSPSGKYLSNVCQYETIPKYVCKRKCKNNNATMYDEYFTGTQTEAYADFCQNSNNKRNWYFTGGGKCHNGVEFCSCSQPSCSVCPAGKYRSIGASCSCFSF